MEQWQTDIRAQEQGKDAMRDHFRISDQLEASVGRGAGFHDSLPVRGHVLVELFGPDGELKDQP